MNIAHRVTVVVYGPVNRSDDCAEITLIVRWLYKVIMDGLEPGAPCPVTRDEAASVIRIDHSLWPIEEPEL